MSKITFGLILGAILGSIDGATAWYYPDARPEIVSIIIGSTFKGLVTGLAAGFAAKRWNSIAAGVGTGLVVGFLLAALVVWMGKQNHDVAGDHPIAIILPGTAIGLIVGIAAHKKQTPPKAAA